MDLDAAASTGLMAGDLRPKVVCLGESSVVERVFAYKNHVQLAQASAVIPGGSPLADLDAGTQVVLDEQGRTATQVVSDLAALRSATTSVQLPLEPMRDLWPKA